MEFIIQMFNVIFLRICNRGAREEVEKMLKSFSLN